MFYLSNQEANGGGLADLSVVYGTGGDVPLAGRWRQVNQFCDIHYGLVTGAIPQKARIAPNEYNPPALNSDGTYRDEVKDFQGYRTRVEKYAVDATNGSTIWVYVASQLQNEGAGPEIPIAGWIPIGSWANLREDATIKDRTCVQQLPDVSNTYTLPNIPWDSFTFTHWPVDVENLCAVDNTRKELWGLNKSLDPNAFDYPRKIHSGVDFFVEQSATNILVKSIGRGIVVGISIYKANLFDKLLEDTHLMWGFTPVVSQESPVGYGVIVRYGHFYVLYGHLKDLPNLWVGKEVLPGEVLGNIGLSELTANRHLHIEIRTYGTDFGSAYQLTSKRIHSSGILPVGGSASVDSAPYFYDLIQLLPNPLHLQGDLSNLVASSNLAGTDANKSAILSFVTATPTTTPVAGTPTPQCQLIYFTQIEHPDTNQRLDEVDGYRGFKGYNLPYIPLISPLTIPSPLP